MEFKIIKTEEDYKRAVKYIEELGDNPDFGNNPELKNKYELIEKLIEDYDKEHYPVEKGDPVEIIKLKMKYMGLKQNDLIPAVGSKGLVSEVLNKKRQLSKKMIRELSKVLNISQEILNKEYELPLTVSKKVTKDITILKEGNFIYPRKLRPFIIIYSKNVYQRQALFNVCIS